MLAKIQGLIGQFFNKTRTLNNQPLNKVSLIVIIIVDLFILGNVFTGLNDISQWHLSPDQAHPCYSEWKSYRESTAKGKDYQIVDNAVNRDRFSPDKFDWQKTEVGHLGSTFPGCISYQDLRNLTSKPADIEITKDIKFKESKASNLRTANNKIKSQYDSTLLEKIAGQSRDKSINGVSAETAKQRLDKNTSDIANLDQEIDALETKLLAKPSVANFLALLKDDTKFKQVASSYADANFWYPSIQLGFQALFLLPLIAIALLIHSIAQRRGYGLVSLISWHLLVIFTIPLLLKIFEFLQVGIIFKWIFDLVSVIFGRLLFLVSFLYILIIPLVGFGIIKASQKFVFNPQVTASKRVQASRCMNCARKIGSHDAHCAHCGYYQYVECQNCHSLTYKNLEYCKECGHHQENSPTP